MIYAIVQFVIIAVVVALSLWQIVKKLMPARVHALQVQGSVALSREDRPEIVQALGKALQPAQAPAKGCGSGCDACKACASFEIKKT